MIKEKQGRDNHSDLGPQYTTGNSFRARAEDRQREYRANTLGVGWSKHGHWLGQEAAAQGANFIVPEAFDAAKKRDSERKGVGARTFENMLSSQAMCFNLFAPLNHDKLLAARVLRQFVPWLARVDAIHIEYTPSNEIFGDQTGLGGVDCDVLIEATSDNGTAAVIVLETKFVEPEFSVCSFTKKQRLKHDKPYCSNEVPVKTNSGACLYENIKHYKYWQRTAELNTLAENRLPADTCPFSGPLWQLWVNHTLVHAEAAARKASRVVFGVVAPEANNALHKDHKMFNDFVRLLSVPESFIFIGVDALINAIRKEAEPGEWVEGLGARYGGI